MSKPFKLSHRLRSFRYAFNGLIDLVKYEHNSRIHLFIMILVGIAGIAFQITNLEWIAVLIAFALVFVTELINSAIERAVDLATEERLKTAKQAKDMAAGAVLFASIISVIIGLIIFLPKILELL